MICATAGFADHRAGNMGAVHIDRLQHGEVARSTLHAAAVFCARWLVIAAALALAGWVATRLLIVVFPLAVALLLAALLAPFVRALRRRGVPRSLTTATVVLTGIAAVAAVLTFVVGSFLSNLPVLAEQLGESLRLTRSWLVQGPLNLEPQQLTGLQQQITTWASNNQQGLARGALTTGSTVGSLLTGTLLTLFALVFFLHDGARLWNATCRIAPSTQRERIAAAGRRAFAALTAFMRATTLVAAVDAAGIGLALVLTGVPLAGPITALVFMGGFVPVIGALVSGVIAVLVTLVTQGLLPAAIILLVVVAVQQLEGNVLQPWLLGDAVRIHPLAIVFGVTGGTALAGVAGALFAVPLITTVHSAVTTWTHAGADNSARGDVATGPNSPELPVQ
ncbi:AI-2E family transporter [Salinifilum ghardaiensis]